MLPCGFEQHHDAELIQSLYQHLLAYDENVTLVLRKKSGKKVDDAEEAAIGEIHNAAGKAIFMMGPKEGVVDLDKAGALYDPLVAFLKQRGFDQDELSYDKPMSFLALYVLLVLGGGLVYSISSEVMFLYPILLGAVALALGGLYVIALSLKPGKPSQAALLGMIMFGIGALMTAPASLLSLPMLKLLRRQKLQRYLSGELM